MSCVRVVTSSAVIASLNRGVDSGAFCATIDDDDDVLRIFTAKRNARTRRESENAVDVSCARASALGRMRDAGKCGACLLTRVGKKLVRNGMGAKGALIPLKLKYYNALYVPNGTATRALYVVLACVIGNAQAR